MIEWTYNLLILLFALIWVVSVWKRDLLLPLKRLASKKYLVLVLAWSLFIAMAFVFVVAFDYLEMSHDIDDAVEAAVESFVNGTNPYTTPVVPRFMEMGHFVLFGGLADSEIVWSYGPYNYLPLDLLVYTASYEVLGGLGSPLWFVITNMLLASLGLFLLNRLLGIAWVTYAPFAGCVVLFLAFDNTSLTLSLMVAAVFARERLSRHREAASVLLFGVASLTKVFAIIPFGCLLLCDIQRAAKKRDWRLLAETSASAAACGVLAFAVIAPFGLSEVMDSTVFVYSSGEDRDDMPMGGTLLSELLLGNEYYSLISVVVVLAAVALSFRFKDVSDRVLLVTIVFLLVSVKSTMAPFSVIGLFLVLRLRGVKLGCESSPPLSLSQPAPPRES